MKMKEERRDIKPLSAEGLDRARTISVSPPKTRPRSLSPMRRSPTDAVPPAQKRQKKQSSIYTFPIINVKSEPESPSPSVSDEDSPSESYFTDLDSPSSSSSGGSTPERHHAIPQMAHIFQQARRDLFNSGIPSHPKVDNVFCYNCKNYGHPRTTCMNRWYHWWPQEYLSRYSWLKSRVHETNPLRKAGKTVEFRQAMIKIDADVEREDKKLNMKGLDQAQRYFACLDPPTRMDGKRTLHAFRRVTPTPSPPPSICQGEPCHFSFEKRVEELERQIEELRLQLCLPPPLSRS